MLPTINGYASRYDIYSVIFVLFNLPRVCAVSFLGYDAMALAVAKPHLRAELENDLKA